MQILPSITNKWSQLLNEMPQPQQTVKLEKKREHQRQKRCRAKETDNITIIISNNIIICTVLSENLQKKSKERA